MKCNENIENLIIPYIFYDKLVFSVIWNKCGSKDETIFKGKESTEISKILGLINNTEEY